MIPAVEELLTSLGPVSAVIGAQWGDEGKGKAIDMLAEHFDVIARAAGGANAGHTIVVGGTKHVFHLLPSGSLHEGKPVVLGAGMVIHLPTLLSELRILREAGIDLAKRLVISGAAHVVCEYHKEMDAMLEERRKERTGKGIGTTKRGIGPAYMEKAMRTGIRVGDLQGDVKAIMEAKAAELSALYRIDVDVRRELQQIEEARDALAEHVVDVPSFLHARMEEGKTILIEGAQASLLDIDHGTYPYVTSSATTAAGAMQGLGLPPQVLTSCVGVAKAYCTRVGEGEFPTEEKGETGDRLRERGGEYGATTGRPRRCGWMHMADMKRVAMLNGFTHWNITKLDVLDEEETVRVGTATDETGTVSYEDLPGWRSSTAHATAWEDLPERAQAFLAFIEKETSVPVSLVGTGPGREDMIVRSRSVRPT